jgi:hypothetical protein
MFEPCEQVVADMGEAIRAEHHTDLDGATLLYVWIDKAPRSQGKLRAGKMMKVPRMYRALLNADFIVLLSKDLWQGMTEAQHCALVDHELSHGYYEGEEPHCRAHDLTEFVGVVERHGLVFPEQQRFAAACAQLELPLGAKATEE